MDPVFLLPVDGFVAGICIKQAVFCASVFNGGVRLY